MSGFGETLHGSQPALDFPPDQVVLLCTVGGIKGKRIPWNDEPLSVGRDPACDLVLPDAAVSWRHAQLEPVGDGRIRVVDLNSRNGTFVNGRRITKAVTRPGDKLGFGKTVFVVALHHDDSAVGDPVPAPQEDGRADSGVVPGEAEERYRSIFNSALDPMLIVDGRLRIKEANRAAAALLLCTVEGLQTMALEDFLPGAAGTLNAELTGADTGRIEFPISRPGGDPIHVDCRFNRIKNKYLLILHDVTARRRLEQEQRARAEQLAAMNALAAQLSRSLDLETVTGTATRLLRRTLGIPSPAVLLYSAKTGELIVAPDAEFRNPDGWTPPAPGTVLPAEGSGFEACLSERRTTRLADLSAVYPEFGSAAASAGFDGLLAVPLLLEERLLGLVLVPCRGPAECTAANVGFIETAADYLATAINNALLHQAIRRSLAELKTGQERVVHQERLRALGQMASGIAHDLNNSLSGIVGFSELLLTGDDLPPAVRGYVEKILTGGRDTAKTVARLREFYRPETGEALEPVDLAQVAAQALELTEPRWKNEARTRSIQIRARAEPGETPTISAKPQEVREALINLIFNAVDALPAGGEIVLRTGCDENSAWVSVSDTGVGISPAVRSRLFEPFFTTKGVLGSGLGLSQCYGIMQRHGGEISVESVLGDGSAFTLKFPLRRTPGEAVGDSPSYSNLPVIGLRVLYVDDEPSVREVVAAMLAELGMQVETADDALQAVRRCASEEFDLVVTDLAMPKMSGLELARQLGRMRPSLPVGLLTGWAAQILSGGSLPERVVAVAEKPPTLAALRKLLGALIERRRALMDETAAAASAPAVSAGAPR